LTAAIELWSTLPEPHPLELAASLGNLSSLRINAGRLEEAEILLLQAISLKTGAPGNNTWSIARTEYKLGKLYWHMGRYPDSEKYLTSAARTAREVLGPDAPLTLGYTNTLGNVYFDEHRYGEALRAYTTALDGAEDEGRRDVGALINVSACYNVLGRYSDAIKAAKKGLAVLDDQQVAADNFQRSKLHRNLGQAYLLEGKTDSARFHIDEDLCITRARRMENTPEWYEGLTNLAKLELESGNLGQADSLYRLVFDGWLRITGADHQHVAQTLLDWAEVVYRQGNVDSAAAMAAVSFDTYRQLLFEHSFGLTEQSAYEYSTYARTAAMTALSYLLQAERDSSQTHRVADIVLATKGIVSDELFRRSRFYAHIRDHKLQSQLHRWRRVRKELAHLSVSEATTEGSVSQDTIDSLSDLRTQLETELALASYEHREDTPYRGSLSEIVSGALPDNCALVEYFFTDRPEHRADEPDGQVLFSIVLKSKGPPEVHTCSRVDSLESLAQAYRSHILAIAGEGRLPSGLDLEAYDVIAADLYQLLWRPLEGSLGGANLVLIAPDGVLNLLSFGGLKGVDGSYLVESQDISYLNAARDVLRKQLSENVNRGLLAFGDPDFDASPQTRLSSLGHAVENLTPLDVATRSQAMRLTRTWSTDSHVSRIPSSRQELASIAQVWSATSSDPLTMFVDAGASEDNLAQSAAGHRIIHLATHGFFTRQEEPGDSVALLSETNDDRSGNPLLSCGLLLAGCNLHGAGANELGVEDGVLTAEEVSLLDLEGVESVVLSACESGIGDVREGEGVFGLRRAFRLAGAGTVVSTLWPVDDRTTAEMMAAVYSLDERSIGRRVCDVQRDRLSRLRNAGLCDHPFGWAAFIVGGSL